MVDHESPQDAVRWTLKTLREQPNEVPEAPAGWATRADIALNEGDQAALVSLGYEIRDAHGQYSADFDRRAWLHDLRLALRTIPATGAACIFGVGDVVRHRKTGGLYEVICTARLEKTREEVVVYRSRELRETWVRPMVEFCDGRFELARG